LWGIIGGVGGALGAILARPLVGAFRGYPPWVLPVTAAGIISALVLAGLLLPLLFGAIRANEPAA